MLMTIEGASAVETTLVEAFVDAGDAGKEVQDALVGTEGGGDEGVGGKQVDELPTPQSSRG